MWLHIQFFDCAGFFVVICGIFVAMCWIFSCGHVGSWFSDLGSNPGPLHWECGVLATGSVYIFTLFWGLLNKFSIYQMCF